MKGDHPRITLLGNNSGRNLGDAAIMSGILDSLSKELPDAEFYVPSITPNFINDNYGDQYNVKGIDVMPWTGSIRLFGIPTLRCITRSDIALICDGIIFGKNLWNPAFNFLITLIFLVPWAKLTGCKVVCYSCGIGPFPSKWSKIFARWVMNGSDLIIMRENDSKAFAKELGVTHPIEVTGDAAFVNPVSSEERAKEIFQLEGISPDKPILGINVTKYIDSWLEPNERIPDKSLFLDQLATGLRDFKDRVSQPVQLLLFSTQPMDEKFTFELADKTGAKVVHNSRYLSHDIQAAMRCTDLFIGMRFHSLVLASAVGVPIVGLVYAPKVRGFMRLLECERYSLELGKLTPEILSERLVSAWAEREGLQNQQQKFVDSLKTGARQAAVTVRERYFRENKSGSELAGREHKTAVNG